MSSGIAVMMVAAGGLCVLGAMISRQWMAIAAATVMMLAMWDTAFVRAFQPIVWSFVLVLLGIGIAATLRLTVTPRPAMVTVGLSRSSDIRVPTQGPKAGIATRVASDRDTEEPSLRRLGRMFTVVAALAYLVMAWQILQHDASARILETVAGSAHSHHSAGPLFDVVLTTSARGLVLILGVCAATALIRRRPALMIESIGMALMLAAMLLPH